MIGWIVVAAALMLSSSVQAMPRAPLQAPDGAVIQIREACGSGHAPSERRVHQNCRPPWREQVCQGSDLLNTRAAVSHRRRGQGPIGHQSSAQRTRVAISQPSRAQLIHAGAVFVRSADQLA